MRISRFQIAALGVAALFLPACGGSDSSKASNSDQGSGSLMNLLKLSNGFGQLVPHAIQELDDNGNPTQVIVSITSQQDLIDNLTLSNTVLPVPKFQVETILPSGLQGNHFLYATLTQPLDLLSILDPSPGQQSNSGFTGAVTVVAIDPVTGTALPVLGRAFIDGQTFASPLDENNQFTLQRWVQLDGFGKPEALLPEGVGFPGTEGNFEGSSDLLGPNVITFVPDVDGDLSTYETFPVGFEIRMRLTTAVRAQNGKTLQNQVLGATTVGDDFLSPEVVTTPPPLQTPLISPGNGDVNVDPLTAIRIEFTEPVQPLSVGALDGTGPPALSSALKIRFGPDASRTDVPFLTRPLSVFDLSIFTLIPAFAFPGAGPEFEQCGTFAQVDINLNPGQIQDLARNPDPNDPNNLLPNTNLLAAQTFFITGEGPGIVNAPVAPDVIYVVRKGASPGISVLDLNGFGQGTGNPTFVEGAPEEEHSNFPNNPNVRFQTGLRPPLAVGTCTIDGGSAGVFTLTRDSSLDDQVVRAPVVADVSDLMIGHALDGTFNNAQFPFGCQAGGGDICTLDGLKIVNPVVSGPNTLGPSAIGQFGNLNAGQVNLISWAPHPNPPPLSFPPLCITPFLLGDEPTSIDNTVVIPIKTNLLAPGDPFGNPLSNPPVPPSGLLTPEQNAFFLGPTQGQINLDNCITYQHRQQVGHFLYVLDRTRGEVTVLNSNRMTVIERIPVSDPTEFAMGPNLDFLAVTNQGANSVTFIDISPKSATLHKIVKTTLVGAAPRGIAWQPGNEDILVVNEGANSMSIISAFSLEVRKTVSNQLNKPFDLVVFPRQQGFSFLRNVYFAYILNRTGRVSMFESGPNGVNGWGFDDIIGIPPFEFQKPKRIQHDPINLNAAAWIVHEGALDPISKEPGPIGEGALSQLFIESAVSGQIFLTGNLTIPGFRDMELGVNVSIGEGETGLSGVPVDIAFDNLRNFGGLPNTTTPFSAGAPIPANGKDHIRGIHVPPAIFNNSEPLFMFVAVPNAKGGFGVVDVMGLADSGVPRKDTNAFLPGVQSVQVPNVSLVMDYFRE